MAGTLVRFLMFGAVRTAGFLADTATVYALRYSLGRYGAGAVAYVVAATVTWVLNRLWTFRGKGTGPIHRQWLRFLCVNLGGFALNRGVYATLLAFVPLCSAESVLAIGSGWIDSSGSAELFMSSQAVQTVGRMFPNIFRTARLILRPITSGDAVAIFAAYAQDPEVTRFLTFRPHVALDDTESYVARCLAPSVPVSRTYVLTTAEDGTVRGAIDLRLAGPHRLEFGFVLARADWGRGLMTEVLRHTLPWALAQPGIFRVGAVCDVDNIASARVMEKAGLTLEGRLRRWLVHPNISDEPRDCLGYARVR